MKKEAEKLNLSNRQYLSHGTRMMIMGILLMAFSPFAANYSLVMPLVMIVIGVQFAYFGYIFRKIAKENETENERENSKRADKISAVISLAEVIIFLFTVAVGVTVAVKGSKQNEIQKATETAVAVTTAEKKNETVTVIGRQYVSREYVYIVDDGKKYHYLESCPGDKSYKITAAEAVKRGYTPCKKCVHE